MITDLAHPQVIVADAMDSKDSNEAGMRAIARANKIAGVAMAYDHEDMVSLLAGGGE